MGEDLKTYVQINENNMTNHHVNAHHDLSLIIKTPFYLKMCPI